MIDITYDFTTDSPGYWEGFWDRNDGLGYGGSDPDVVSRTLQLYHRTLWSKPLCKALELCESSYYQWLKGERRRRERQEREQGLIKEVKRVFEETNRVYGCRRLRRALSEQGIELSEWKVRRIMPENGMYPKTMKKYKPGKSGTADGKYFENVLEQEFSCERPNEKWVGDITYLRTIPGWVYLAAVIELYNREVIGYSISRGIDTELTCRALENALQRRGESEGPLIFHSDRGC